MPVLAADNVKITLGNVERHNFTANEAGIDPHNTHLNLTRMCVC